MDDFVWVLFGIIQSPLFFLAFAFMIKCLFISFYCLLLYGVILAVKRILSKKMRIRAHYYSWYALLLSFPLAGMWWNDAIKIPLYGQFLSNWGIINSGGIINRGHIVSRGVILFWLLVVLFQLCAQMIAGHRVRKSIAKMKPYPDKDGLVQQAAEAVGLRTKCINVVLSDAVRSPVSYGVLKKTILLPQDYNTKYSLSELYLLLLHEMSHLKNHDTIKLQLLAYAEPFFWALRLIVKSFKRDTEILCDNRVISIQNNPGAYGSLLLKESANKNEVKGFAFSDSYRAISSRLHALNNYRPEKHKLAVFSVAVFAVLLFGFGWSYWHPSGWFYINDAHQEDFTVKIEYTAYEYNIAEDDLQLAGERVEETDYLSQQELVEQTESMEEQEFLEMVREVQVFQPNDLQSVYEVVDGELRVDKLALYEAVKPFERQDMPITTVRFESLHSALNIRYIEQETLSSYTFDIHDLVSVDENNRYEVRSLKENTLEDIIYFVVARWG